MNQPKPFECQFCHASFVHEDRYLKHECKEMKRDAEIKTNIGQMAFAYYKLWFEVQRKRAPMSSTFVKSTYYTQFIRFAQFAKRVKIPDPKLFVRLMKDKALPPSMWTRNDVYAIYLEHMDRTLKPLDQVTRSIDTLFDIAEDARCDISEVFGILTPNMVIQLIHEKKLSPWLLLKSKKFLVFFQTKTNQETKLILEAIIRPSFWIEKFKQFPKEVQTITQIVKQLDL